MKKKILAVMAAVMVMAMGSMTAFAATSPVAGAITPETAFSGVSVEEDGVTATATTQEAINAAVAEINADGYASFSIKAALDVTGTPGVPFTVNVPGIAAGANVVAYHEVSAGNWEVVTPNSVADGKVVITLNSFSPVVIVEVQAAAASANGSAATATTATSTTTVVPAPQTGETAPMVAVMAVICLAGVAVCGKKVYA